MTTKLLKLAFLLKGKVQGVKLRRYVESAARHFGVGGYVINTPQEEGHNVFGEAWVSPSTNDDGDENAKLMLESFGRWIRGEHRPAVCTNVKPVPVGTAYPQLARVDQFVVQQSYNMSSNNTTSNGENESNHEFPLIADEYIHKYQQFTMVRDDEEAIMILKERRQVHDSLLHLLSSSCTDPGVDSNVEIGAWPPRDSN